MTAKIEAYPEDTNRRWLFKPYGWPASAGTISVNLQQKKRFFWFTYWSTIGSNYALSPGEVGWIKQVILDAPRLRQRRAEREDRERAARDLFLRGSK